MSLSCDRVPWAFPPHSVSVGLPALAGRGKEQIPEGSMPDGSSIIHKLDEPSMGESGFSRRLPPLGGSGLQILPLTRRSPSPLHSPVFFSPVVLCLPSDAARRFFKGLSVQLLNVRY